MLENVNCYHFLIIAEPNPRPVLALPGGDGEPDGVLAPLLAEVLPGGHEVARVVGARARVAVRGQPPLAAAPVLQRVDTARD